MTNRVVHATAVEAVSTWVALALRACTVSSHALPSSTDLAIAHTVAVTSVREWIKNGLVQFTAATSVREWIQDGLDEFQHQQQKEPCVEQSNLVTVAETEDDDLTHEALPAQADVVLETIRLLAESVTSIAIQLALTQLLPEEAAGVNDVVLNDPEEVESMTCVRSARDGDSHLRPHAGDNPVAPPPVRVPSTLRVEISDDESESRGRVASQFVTSLLINAVHHLATMPTTVDHKTLRSPLRPLAKPSPLTPTPSPLPVESVLTNRPSTPTADNDAPPPSHSDVQSLPIVFPAVKPPKQGSRRHHRKPIASMRSSSPCLTLTPVGVPTPTTADHQHHLIPSGSRPPPPHTLPRPVSHEPACSLSPPRLRKLGEYLELHPVDHAKRVYRPRRPPPHDPHHHFSAAGSVHASSYDAEHEGSDNENGNENENDAAVSPPPPRVKLASLRGAAHHPLLPSPTTILRTAKAAVVDRPDRLGLLTKPKKRSGFCQQCGFEGRPCKVNDCLKHQLLR